jgi:hypothetical protein
VPEFQFLSAESPGGRTWDWGRSGGWGKDTGRNDAETAISSPGKSGIPNARISRRHARHIKRRKRFTTQGLEFGVFDQALTAIYPEAQKHDSHPRARTWGVMAFEVLDAPCFHWARNCVCIICCMKNRIYYRLSSSYHNSFRPFPGYLWRRVLCKSIFSYRPPYLTNQSNPARHPPPRATTQSCFRSCRARQSSR